MKPATDPEMEAAITKATPDLLKPYVSEKTVRLAMQDFEADGISCPLEIIVMAAALNDLHGSTEDHANDLDADDFLFRADEARQRAGAYQASYEALKEVWR